MKHNKLEGFAAKTPPPPEAASTENGLLQASHQLSLFNEEEGGREFARSLELFSRSIPIAESGAGLLLKKSSARIRFVRPLRLLQRQLHNALLFAARPALTRQDVFEVSLEYLSWVVGHSTHKGYSYLKEALEDMQQSLVQISSEDKWFSTQILQDVLVDGGTLYYRIPPILRALYCAPKRYYHVSLGVGARFNSRYTHALYELLRENLWRRNTGEIPLPELRERLGIGADEYTEFKRLNARVLQPSLEELSKVADYRAESRLISHGRFVVAVSFSIFENQAWEVLPGPRDFIDAERFRILREDLGLSSPRITELVDSFGQKRLAEVTDVIYCRYVLEKRTVRNGPALVLNALQDKEDRYFLTSAEKATLEASRARAPRAELSASAVPTPETDKARAFVLSWWEAEPEEQRRALWEEFVANKAGSVIARAAKLDKSGPDLKNPLVQAAFGAFLRKRLSPEASPLSP